jgi:uncharacterized Rmd1/YagE family protein
MGARALLLAARLDLRSWPESEIVARAPLAVRVAGGGTAVLFRYGAAVLFGVSADSERAFRERVAAVAVHRYRNAEIDELAIRVDEHRAEGMMEDALSIHAAGTERLQLIADALSKSLLLSHYEARIAGDVDRLEPLALELERRGTIRGGTRAHLRRIGALLLMEHRMLGRAEVGEKPEVLWEHPRLERLHALLEAEFEIRERLVALDRKLGLAARIEGTLVELIRTRHALRVEWYIVGLFVLEIALSVYSMAAR